MGEPRGGTAATRSGTDDDGVKFLDRVQTFLPNPFAGRPRASPSRAVERLGWMLI
jgi:hypothetical protein